LDAAHGHRSSRVVQRSKPHAKVKMARFEAWIGNKIQI